ncbi:Hexuronate transporter [Phycisphaerales bacterium]|nr:Hexuronate transporter [Phycisphaerales bacterium]
MNPDRIETPGLGVRGLVRSARASLALLLAINLFNYIDRYVLAAAMPAIRAEFFPDGGPTADTKLGLLTTAFMVTYMLAAPIFGWLGDRTSRWKIIAIGVLVWSLASGASGLAITFGMLLLTRVFVGVGEAAYGPTAPTIIADLYPVERRGSVMAWFYMAIPVGSALGFAIGGVLTAAFSWHMAFYAVVAPGIALAAVAAIMRDPPRGQSDPNATGRERARWADYLLLLRTPSYVYNTLGMTAMTFAIGGLSTWMPTYITDFRNVPNSGTTSVVFGALTAATGLTATLAGGWFADRLRTRNPGSYFLVSGVSMLIGFPLFLAVLFTPFPWAWVAMGAAMFCLFFNTGPSNTIIANVTHSSMRATAYALNILVIHLFGDALSPTLIGAVLDATKSDKLPRGNATLAFSLVGIAFLVGGVLWLLGTRHLEKDTRLAPTRLRPASPDPTPILDR